jgi:creatinine amidohydrolase
MTTVLAELSWPEVADRAARGAFLAVPVGSTEQHGPHLPLATDTDIAVALCGSLAVRRCDVLVAPAVAYGSSGEHAGFAGTLSIGQAALELLLVELVRSAAETFPNVLLVSAHGGNSEPVRRAVGALREEGRDVLLFEPRWDGDAHAGRTETALQLLLHPWLVAYERAEPGNSSPLAELMPRLRKGGLRAVSANGVLGDPTGATAAGGAELLGRLSAELCEQVDAWRSA